MKLRVVIFQERDQWVAVGLERFFGGQGATPLDALKDLARDIYMQRLLEQRSAPELLVEVPPADAPYQQLWDTAPLRLTWEEAEGTAELLSGPLLVA